jgi:hypothetical protein
MAEYAVDASKSDYKISLTRALNALNLENESKDAKKFLQKFADAKKIEINLSAIADTSIRPTFGWLAALSMSKGVALSEEHTERLVKYVKSLSGKEKTPTKVMTARPSVQEATQNIIDEYIGYLEYVFDQLFKGELKAFDLYIDLKSKQLPKQAVPEVQAWIKEKIKYFIAVYESKDEQVKEAYRLISKRELKKILGELAEWIEQSNKYGEFKKANRKPRKKKEKAPVVQVAKINYLKEDTTLGIKSIAPADIIGATQVLTYNVKTRKIILFRTESASGIKCKGSTLQNYEPELSLQKTLRKPAEQLKEVLALSKVKTRKFIENIKAKSTPVKGRINKDTMILRAMK